MTDRRRTLPSVDRLMNSAAITQAGAGVSRPMLVRAVRGAIQAARAGGDEPQDEPGWARAVTSQLAHAATPTLRRAINATGVVLHTNLGRAPLARAAIDAITAAASGYSTLEYDVARGARGSRHVHCADLLTELTGAQDAMVVNNAASALLLVLAATADGGDVIVSRGELIEIGGGFRIPEIMERSGARLVEVGTTNRTRVGDYAQTRRRAGAQVSAILKVHRSNFKLEGFTAEASLQELVALGRKKKIPVLYDLGSGLMTDLAAFGLGGEPTLPAAAKSGAAAVVASGDKLLGGPQAGIIVGSKRTVSACRAHPLARAVRADKLTLAGLAATLGIYRDADDARCEIPVLRMLTARVHELEGRARALASRLPGAAGASVIATKAAVGGGAFPGLELESRGIALGVEAIAADELARRLRDRALPVIGTVQKSRVVLDLRTLLPFDDDDVVTAVAEALRT